MSSDKETLSHELISLASLVYGLPLDEAAARLSIYRDRTGLDAVALRERILAGAVDLDEAMAQ